VKCRGGTERDRGECEEVRRQVGRRKWEIRRGRKERVKKEER
jgi:hypothetical protein